MTVTITCGECGIQFERRPIDLVRSNGRPMYCSLQCFGLSKFGTGKVWPEVKKSCLQCKKEFTVTQNLKTVFCSRSCASKGSRGENHIPPPYNPYNSKSIAAGMKKREAWKYVELKEILRDRDHEFEFEFNGRIFDLLLRDVNILVEFDSDYHEGCLPQIKLDDEKTKIAEDAGFWVVRLKTGRNEVIPASLIQGL